MTQEELDRLHACDICRDCQLKPGCQTEPNFGCQFKELERRRCAHEHREPIDSDAVLVCDTAADLDAAIRILRRRLHSGSPVWLRELYGGLRRMQQRLEERGGPRTEFPR